MASPAGVPPRGGASDEYRRGDGRAPPACVGDRPEIAAPGGIPSFVGLSMREALVRAHTEGWQVEVHGSGYVVQQLPPAGAVSEDHRVTLHFGSNVS
jgi:hypothetical protein